MKRWLRSTQVSGDEKMTKEYTGKWGWKDDLGVHR